MEIGPGVGRSQVKGGSCWTILGKGPTGRRPQGGKKRKPKGRVSGHRKEERFGTNEETEGRRKEKTS